MRFFRAKTARRSRDTCSSNSLGVLRPTLESSSGQIFSQLSGIAIKCRLHSKGCSLLGGAICPNVVSRVVEKPRRKNLEPSETALMQRVRWCCRATTAPSRNTSWSKYLGTPQPFNPKRCSHQGSLPCCEQSLSLLRLSPKSETKFATPLQQSNLNPKTSTPIPEPLKSTPILG